MRTLNRPTVLIFAGDSAFSREITACWPNVPDDHLEAPEFTVLDQVLCGGLEGSHYDLVIADVSAAGRKVKRKSGKLLNPRRNGSSLKEELADRDIKQVLAASGKPAIVIHSDHTRDLYDIHGTIVVLRREPGTWAALAGLLGREMLCRFQAESRCREAENICAVALAEATLGRYMVEMRTNINNALTTVLGNAELLTHEPGLPATVQAQADAIRNMALRLHEIIQRFSSIEKELKFTNLDSGKKAVGAGSGC